MSDKKLIKVIVQDTENILFDGEVDRLTSFNEVGRFDVYPMHANFISIIRQELALYLKHEKIKEVQLEQAIMKVKQDVINVFLGIEAFAIADSELQSPVEPPKK
jgi:F0F1-type ATP synthase epsilon subunit